MDWQSIVFKMILRKVQRYLGYLLACVLAIAVFAIFMIFSANPKITDAHVSSGARMLFITSQVIVGIFAGFFIFYFHGALIRVRNKEFGLLLTLGINQRQLGLLLFYESLFIGLLALMAGMGLGIAGSPPFMLAVGKILALPKAIPFVLSPGAIWFTLAFFGVVFLLDARQVARSIVRRSPRMLILGSRQQQQAPRPSLWRVLVGGACTVAAYVMAIVFSLSILWNAIPIIGLTIVGTYLLFSQIFVMLLARLRRVLKGTSLLTVSRISYRMKDYARMITTVTVLNALVLTGMSAVFGVREIFGGDTGTPFALELAINAEHPGSLSASQVRVALQAHHLAIQSEVVTPLLAGQINTRQRQLETSILSFSAFQQLRATIARTIPQGELPLPSIETLAQDEVYVITPDPINNLGNQAELHLDQTTLVLRAHQVVALLMDNIMDNVPAVHSGPPYAVVSDQTYASLSTQALTSEHWQVYSYMLPDWQQSQSVVAELRQSLLQSEQGLLRDKVTSYLNASQLLSVMLFAGFFVSLLFFLAAGCSLYFKLFNQQEEDRRQFRALQRMGFQRHEVSQVLTWEFLLLFFVPVAVGMLHSSVAILDLIHLFTRGQEAQNSGPYVSTLWQAFGAVCLIYIACFLVFFLVARVNYLRRMQQVEA